MEEKLRVDDPEEDVKEEEDERPVDDTPFDPDKYMRLFSMFFDLITIRKIHIRFEDDYFAGEHPYSFGLVIRELRVFNFDKDITFESPVSVNYDEIVPKN